MNIIVMGGRGLVGRNIVQRLRTQGHCVSAASRSTGVDLVTGKGLAASLAGADVVVDVSNSPTFDDMAAFEFFKAAIFKINSTFMREMKASGFNNLGMEELVKARIFKIVLRKQDLTARGEAGIKTRFLLVVLTGGELSGLGCNFNGREVGFDGAHGTANAHQQ